MASSCAAFEVKYFGKYPGVSVCIQIDVCSQAEYQRSCSVSPQPLGYSPFAAMSVCYPSPAARDAQVVFPLRKSWEFWRVIFRVLVAPLTKVGVGLRTLPCRTMDKIAPSSANPPIWLFGRTQGSWVVRLLSCTANHAT